MKRYFLTDLENVGKWSVVVNDKEVLSRLTGEDVIVAFSNGAHTNGSVPLDFLEAIAGTRAAYRSVEINCDGKNALDFVLASTLGMLIKEDGSRAEYWIVSNDRGFEACREFAKAQGVKVGITPTIDVRESKEMTDAAQREMLKELLPEFSGKAITLTQRCLRAARDVGDYHNRLQGVLYESQRKEAFWKTRHLIERKCARA